MLQFNLPARCVGDELDDDPNTEKKEDERHYFSKEGKCLILAHDAVDDPPGKVRHGGVRDRRNNAQNGDHRNDLLVRFNVFENDGKPVKGFFSFPPDHIGSYYNFFCRAAQDLQIP